MLSPRDGWAASGSGTTGGADAAARNVFTVSTRGELVQALEHQGSPAAPRIVYVEGTIRGDVSAEGEALSCVDYAVDGYSREAYLRQYDPDTWGNKPPAGPLEEARQASQDIQAEHVRIEVGSNTTIVGLGSDARMERLTLALDGVDNVIIRNIEFANAFDCFPAWDPGDSGGKWNSEYDNVSLHGATHVWIDHCSFSDGDTPDSELPEYFGSLYQVHDGLLDITDGSDYVTVSYNEFRNHAKSMLIGSTDDPDQDRGKLNVTVHHNFFTDLEERAPRVRFGKVHLYNNYYRVRADGDYVYTWGVGVESKIYARNNYFRLDAGIRAADIPGDYRGSTLYAEGTLVNGRTPEHRVDVVAAYNAAHDPDFSRDVGWEPVLHRRIHPTQAVPAVVSAHAGSGKVG